MNILCSPSEDRLLKVSHNTKCVLLYGRSGKSEISFCGAQIKKVLVKEKYKIDSLAWDFVSIALSVIAADKLSPRKPSPDGWTRTINLKICMPNPTIWEPQKDKIEQILNFLTTDIWSISFVRGGEGPPKVEKVIPGDENSVALVSGGLDSLIGLIDLRKKGFIPLPVSQVVRGDREKQIFFCEEIGCKRHLQLTNSLQRVAPAEPSQRARSILFIAYGILGACSTRHYQKGNQVTLYICENGFISINPPLTSARIGSLSTRTTHPVYIARLQELITDLGINVKLENPYQFKTKGEMLLECKDQKKIFSLADKSTSCSRYLRNACNHCGRCVPCIIRRAAFKQWMREEDDENHYLYKDLGINDKSHALFDDIRSAAIAVNEMKEHGVESLLDPSLMSSEIDDPSVYESVINRGIAEIDDFLSGYEIK